MLAASDNHATHNSDDHYVVTKPTTAIIPRPRPIPPAPLHIRCPRRLRGWTFCEHARRHIDDRRFSPHEVIRAIEAPEVVTYGHTAGRSVHLAGHLMVIIDPGSRTVITALLRSERPWTDADARAAGGWAV